MTISPEDGDYWTNLSGASVEDRDGPPPPALSVETIDGVEPLGAQLGVAEPLTVPPSLHEALFGQPGIIDGRAVLPLHTYAVLDAAKLPGLPEMLEASGLDHACLFLGIAAKDYRDVAPYLVRLQEGHGFTRKLFSQGDAPWEMWDAGLGIFLRSQGTLDELRRHLRKFTRVQDDRAGGAAWVYLRFWEPTLLTVLAARAAAVGQFWEAFAFAGSIVVTDPFLRRAQLIRLEVERGAARLPFVIDGPMRAAMREQRIESFARRLGSELLKESWAEMDRCRLLEDVRRALRLGLDHLMTDTRHLARFVRVALTAEAADPSWQLRPDVAALFSEGHDPGRLLPELEHRVRAPPVAGARA